MKQSIEAIIIGNEILSGRRQDVHFANTMRACEARGLRLSAVHFLSDNREQLIHAYRQTLNNGSIVLSFGGIGATPDDCTRQAASTAFARPLVYHPEGKTILHAKFGDNISPQHYDLIAFPEGANLIPNPVNQVPGFSLLDHHFVPGFPTMATPMIAWVLDNYYADLEKTGGYLSLIAYSAEAKLIPLLELLEKQFRTQLSISCLPQSNGKYYAAEIGFEGDDDIAVKAKSISEQWLAEQGIDYRKL